MNRRENRSAAYLLEQASLTQKVVRRVDGALSVHGISFTEYQIMLALNDAPNQTLRRIELAESVGITASGVTRLLAPMEKIKLVEKRANPRDARVSLVKLSAPGQRVFNEAAQSIEHCAASITQGLEQSELQILRSLNAKVRLSI